MSVKRSSHCRPIILSSKIFTLNTFHFNNLGNLIKEFIVNNIQSEIIKETKTWIVAFLKNNISSPLLASQHPSNALYLPYK